MTFVTAHVSRTECIVVADQTLTLVPTVSNCNNFLLERDSERPLELSAHTALRVPLTFLPSALGPGPHRATVSFHCEQVQNCAPEDLRSSGPHTGQGPNGASC